MNKTNTKKTNHKATKRVRQHVKHALVPHKANGFRPHLIRWQGVSLVLALVIVGQLIYGVALHQGGVLGRVSNIDTAQLLVDTNAARAEEKLPALQTNAALNQAAQLKAKDMLAHNYWAHTSPTGVAPWEWLNQAGYRYDRAGENLAKNYPTADSTVSAWMASETHRANIMNAAYTDVGFAVLDGQLEGRDATLVVAFYGTPAGTTGVAGEQTDRTVFAAPVAATPGNPLTYFGTALQSLTPATLGALALLIIVSGVALAAHHYRKQLPKAWRQTWRIHHGMYTFIGAFGLAIMLVLATGGGQI